MALAGRTMSATDIRAVTLKGGYCVYKDPALRPARALPMHGSKVGLGIVF